MSTHFNIHAPTHTALCSKACFIRWWPFSNDLFTCEWKIVRTHEAALLSVNFAAFYKTTFCNSLLEANERLDVILQLFVIFRCS